MYVTLIKAMPPKRTMGLDKLSERVVDVLVELGLNVKEIDLYDRNISFYNGGDDESLSDIMENIRDASGLIFAVCTQLPGVPAILHALLEHFKNTRYADALMYKNCMLLVVSENGGDRACLEQLALQLQCFNAFDSIRVGMRMSDAAKVDAEDEARDVFERQLEDYFRMVRQSRRFFIPADYMCDAEARALPRAVSADPTASDSSGDTILSEDDLGQFVESQRKESVEEVTKRLNLNDMENHSTHISEISSYFTKKLNEHYRAETRKPVYVHTSTREKVVDDEAPKVMQRIANVKQLSRSLTCHFQPQLANGLNAVIQVSVSGSDNFSGFYNINNTQCEFYDGMAKKPDITISGDTAVWGDVLTGKYSAQKAFMIGKLKVRGNYVLLTKFDHIFKMPG